MKNALHSIGRVIRRRVTATELRFLRRTHPDPERVDLSRGVTERGEEDPQGERRGTARQPQVQAPCGICDRHMEDNQRLLSPAKPFTGDARQKSQRGQPIGETTGSGWSLEEGQARHAGERSTSRTYYRIYTCDTTALPLRAPITRNSWRHVGDR